MRSVHCVDGNNATIVGQAGIILHTSNGGTSWQAQNSTTNSTLYGVAFTSTSNGVAVGAQGITIYSTNGGSNWIGSIPPMFQTLYAVAFANNGVGLAVGDNRVTRSTDNGISWFPQTSPLAPFLSVQFVDRDTVVMTSVYGAMRRSNNGGVTWVDVSASTVSSLTGIAFANQTTGVVVSGDGSIFRTTDAGRTWGSRPSNTTNTLLGVSFGRGDTGVAVGERGTILRTTDAGFTWASQTSGTLRTLGSVSMTSGLIGTVVGDSGTILHTTSGGVVSVDDGGKKEAQMPFSLRQNFPNPFNPITTVSFSISSESRVTLTLYDLAGRALAILVDEVKMPGLYNTRWDATAFSSGVYFCRLRAGEYEVSRKMLLIK